MAPQWKILGLSAALAATASAPSQAYEPGMTRIPETVLHLGTDMDGLMAAAEECSHRHYKEKVTGSCAPEDLSTELSAPTPVLVPSFFLDLEEVSVEDYGRCVRAGRCDPAERASLGRFFQDPKIPIVFVNFYDAQQYCSFRSARLPTEAEFEAAARGSTGRAYPWGNLYHRGRANAGRAGARVTDDRDGYELLAPTRSYPDGRTATNVLNLSGNAAEWTATVLGPHETPPGQRSSNERVVKGGSFADDPIVLRATARRGVSPNHRSATIGFRCAKSIFSRILSKPKEKQKGA